MEKIIGIFQKMSLRKALLSISGIVLILVTLVSVFTIFAVSDVRQDILDTRPITIKNSEMQYKVNLDTEDNSPAYIIEPENYSYGALTTANQIKYIIITFLLAGLPILYVILGSISIVKFYYKVKLSAPLEALKNGIGHIASCNLDFELDYHSEDELGTLCAAFETMRKELCENNQRMWNLLQEQKALTDSISHDLRTPVTVTKGYLEYLTRAMAKNQLTEDTLKLTIQNMNQAVRRLERYVNCIQDVRKMEEIKLEINPVNVREFVSNLENDFTLLAAQHQKKFELDNRLIPEIIHIDKNMLFKILENLLNNALHFSKKSVLLTLTENEEYIIFLMQDDGDGFTPEALGCAASLFYTSVPNSDNFGIGLYICDALCQKAGGSLRLYNGNDTIWGGACVEIKIRKLIPKTDAGI
jgi:signal transduction histidine kinase